MKKFLLALLIIAIAATICSCDSNLQSGEDNPLPTEYVNNGEIDYHTALEIALNQFPKTETSFSYSIDTIECSYANDEEVLIEGKKNNVTIWHKQIPCRHTELTTMDIGFFITKEKSYVIQDFKLFVFDTKTGEIIEFFDMDSVTMMTHSKEGQHLFISGPYNDEIFVFDTTKNQVKTILIDSNLILAEIWISDELFVAFAEYEKTPYESNYVVATTNVNSMINNDNVEFYVSQLDERDDKGTVPPSPGEGL